MIPPPDRAPLVAVAHGSRDPRSSSTIRELVDVARRRAPERDIRAAFLDLSQPRLGEVLDRLRSAGHGTAVVAPLLLGSAYHARTDLPAIISGVTGDGAGFGVTTADVLGIDPALEEVALDRLRQAGADPDDPGLGIVVAAVGSSHPPANEAVRRLARRWQRDNGALCTAAFATAAEPDVAGAVARLRARGARRIALASWFLAPGLLPDRVTRQARTAHPDVRIAAPLGCDPRVADVLLHRHAAAVETAHGHRPEYAGPCVTLSA